MHESPNHPATFSHEMVPAESFPRDPDTKMDSRDPALPI